MRPWMFLLAAPLLAGACNDQPPLLAPDTTVLEGVSLHMSVGFEKYGSWLSVAVTLGTPDSTVLFPSTVIADSVWLVNGHETWASPLTEFPQPPGFAVFESSDTAGPDWPVCSIVDVFVTVKDGPHRRLLEAPRQQMTPGPGPILSAC